MPHCKCTVPLQFNGAIILQMYFSFGCKMSSLESEIIYLREYAGNIKSQERYNITLHCLDSRTSSFKKSYMSATKTFSRTCKETAI